MYIDILNIVEGDEYTLEFSIKGDDSIFGARNIKFADELQITGKYVYNQKTLIVNATLKFEITAECDRCLQNKQIKLSVPFNEAFTADNHYETYRIVNNRVELNQAVMEYVLLNIPDRILCKEDCRGICPVCGCDLNTEECECDTETDDKNPFAILKTIVGGAKNGSTKK